MIHCGDNINQSERKTYICLCVTLIFLFIVLLCAGIGNYFYKYDSGIALIVLSAIALCISVGFCVYNCIKYPTDMPDIPIRLQEDMGLV